MKTKIMTATFLAVALSTTAYAQTNAPAPSANPPAASGSSTAVVPAQTMAGDWQASKVIGLSVYNDQNDKIGTIDELMLNKDGKIDKVAIGVGGFLGMGKHDVAVEWSKLKFVDTAVQVQTSSNAGTTTTTNRTTTGTGTLPSATTTTTTSSKRNYPDHAVLSGANKDQLKSMPEFDYTK